MQAKVVFDFSRKQNGVILLRLEQPSATEGMPADIIDQELVTMRHPALLRVRLRLAYGRMIRRQRKIKKFLDRIAAKS